MGTNLIGIGNYIRNNKVMGEGGNPIHPNLVEFWDFRNKTNDDEDRNKVVGWKKNILNLYNFAYKGNSGYGLYNTSIDKWNFAVSNSEHTDTNTSRTFTTTVDSIGFCFSIPPHGTGADRVTDAIDSFQFEVKGLVDGSVLEAWSWSESVRVYFKIYSDGIYTYPYSYEHKFAEDDPKEVVGLFLRSAVEDQQNSPITIKLIPDKYEGALVLDGVDDFGRNSNFPQLKDYTVICKREHIELVNNTALLSKRYETYGAFTLEHTDTVPEYKEYSFGTNTKVSKFVDDKITWQTATSYNGKNIVRGSGYDSTLFLLGKLFQSDDYPTAKAAVYYIAIYDRSLTQKEINDEIRRYEGKTSWRDDMVLHWEFGNKTNSDYTTSSGPVSNPIIEDLSGNGHHGSLKNFAFEGTSGFGYYPVIFGSNKTWKNNGYTRITDGSIINSTEPYTVKSIVFQCRKSSISDANDSVLTFYQLPQGEFGSTIHWCIVTEAHVDESLVEGWNFANNYNDSDGKNKLVGVKGNELVLRNFAYEGMSGWNGYDVVFGAGKTWLNIRTSSSDFIGTYNGSNIHITRMGFGGALQSTYVKLDGEITSNNGEIPAFKMKIEGLENKFMIYYYYLKDSLATQTSFIKITEDGVYDIPKSFAATTNLILDNVWVGFVPIRNSGDTTQYYDCDLTIEVLPSLDNCIVTDGIDDYMECSTLPTLYPYYTFIYKRKWLSRDPGKFHYFLSKGGKTQPIGIEHYVTNPGVPDYETMVNAGVYNRLPISNDNINFMSDAYYNSFELKKGTTSDADMSLLLGGLRDSAFTNSAIYWLYIYNRTLTNDEIKKEIKRIEDKYYE